MKHTGWVTLLAVAMVAIAAPYSMTSAAPEVPALVQQAPFTAVHGPTIKAFEPGQTPLQRLVDHIAPEHVRPDGLTAQVMLFALASVG
jgi:hypothetical protein